MNTTYNINIPFLVDSFLPGECVNGNLMKETILLSENDCLNFCKMDEGCNWFTFNSGLLCFRIYIALSIIHLNDYCNNRPFCVCSEPYSITYNCQLKKLYMLLYGSLDQYNNI